MNSLLEKSISVQDILLSWQAIVVMSIVAWHFGGSLVRRAYVNKCLRGREQYHKANNIVPVYGTLLSDEEIENAFIIKMLFPLSFLFITVEYIHGCHCNAVAKIVELKKGVKCDVANNKTV